MDFITNKQLQKLHIMLKQLGLNDDKEHIVFDASGGRTKSSKELTINEARNLISELSEHDPDDRMRRKVYALAYDANIIYGDTPADKRMNTAKLNMFLLSHGSIKKDLNKMTHKELVKTVSQFEQIVKHKSESAANKATKSLLNELNIESSFKSH